MNLFKLVSVSSIILGFSFILRFLLTIALAKYLSASQLGIYSWAVTAFGITGIIANFGLDFFLIRKIPEYRNSLNGMVQTVINHTKKQAGINSLLLILLIIPISFFSSYLFDGAKLYNTELIIIIFALPFAAFSLINTTSLRAFDLPIRAQFIESILQTGVLLFIVYIAFGFFGNSIPDDLSTVFLVFIFVFSWVLSLIFSHFEFKKHITTEIPLEPSQGDVKEWRMDQSTIVFGVLGWSFLGRSDVFLLAFLVSPAEVGAYFICLRLAEIVTFFSTVSYYVWGGEISNMIQSNKLYEAQVILRKSSQLCIITTLVITIIAGLFTEEILYLVNERYLEYSNIFKGALFVFFIKGASGMLNPMYYILGDQTFLAKLQWALGLFFTGLVVTTVPVYGLEGCILSFAICEILYVIILLIRLQTKHNLSLSPFSFRIPATDVPIPLANETNEHWIEWLGLWGSGKSTQILRIINNSKIKYTRADDFIMPLSFSTLLKTFFYTLGRPLICIKSIRLLFILLPTYIRIFFKKDYVALGEYRSFFRCYMARLKYFSLNNNKNVLWEGEIHLLPSLRLSNKSLSKALDIILSITNSPSLNFVVMSIDPADAYQRVQQDIMTKKNVRFQPGYDISIKIMKEFLDSQDYLINRLDAKGYKLIEINSNDVTKIDKFMELL